MDIALWNESRGIFESELEVLRCRFSPILKLKSDATHQRNLSQTLQSYKLKITANTWENQIHTMNCEPFVRLTLGLQLTVKFRIQLTSSSNIQTHTTDLYRSVRRTHSSDHRDILEAASRIFFVLIRLTLCVWVGRPLLEINVTTETSFGCLLKFVFFRVALKITCNFSAPAHNIILRGQS